MKCEDYVLAIKLYKDGLRIMEAKEDSSPDIHMWATAAREELALCEQLLSRPPRFFGPKVRQNARARIPLPIEVTGPMQIDFAPTCFGSPPVWRQKPWGVWKPNKMEHLFPPAPANIDADMLIHAFLARRMINDEPAVSSFAAPVRMPSGWVRRPWVGMPSALLATLEDEGWVRAWHGTVLQSLYSTTHWGCLLASCLPGEIDRFFPQVEAVYCYNDHWSPKALGACYSPYTLVDPIHGGWIRVMWEVRVKDDRRLFHKQLSQSRQWAFDPLDVVLTALWSHSTWTPDLPLHSPFVFSWRPEEEAHPDAEENHLRVRLFDLIRRRRQGRRHLSS